MENVNIRRITIAGEIDNVSQIYENEVYTYIVGIRKVDGGVWRVNMSEDLYFKVFKNGKAIYDLTMVFENDNVYGTVNTNLSKVEAVYVKGKDITDEEYIAQQETDKSWLMTEENLETISVGRKKSILKAFVLIFLIAVGFTYPAVSSWTENVGDCSKYKDYVMVSGIITNYRHENQACWYDVEYFAENGKKYVHHEKLKEIDSNMPVTGDDVPIIYNPQDYEDVYIGVRKILWNCYVPAKYAVVAPTYILCIMAIAFDLGAIALWLMTVNKTASKYFRLLIPLSLMVFSIITAVICGPIYHIWGALFMAIFMVMIYMRIKKGFKYTGVAKVMIGGESI